MTSLALLAWMLVAPQAELKLEPGQCLTNTFANGLKLQTCMMATHDVVCYVYPEIGISCVRSPDER